MLHPLSIDDDFLEIHPVCAETIEIWLLIFSIEIMALDLQNTTLLCFCRGELPSVSTKYSKSSTHSGFISQTFNRFKDLYWFRINNFWLNQLFYWVCEGKIIALHTLLFKGFNKMYFKETWWENWLTFTFLGKFIFMNKVLTEGGS